MKAPDFTLEEVKEYLHSEVHYIEAVGVFKDAILDHIERLEDERDEAYQAICTHCQDIPCWKDECYWYNKMHGTHKEGTA